MWFERMNFYSTLITDASVIRMLSLQKYAYSYSRIAEKYIIIGILCILVR